MSLQASFQLFQQQQNPLRCVRDGRIILLSAAFKSMCYVITRADGPSQGRASASVNLCQQPLEHAMYNRPIKVKLLLCFVIWTSDGMAWSTHEMPSMTKASKCKSNRNRRTELASS